MKSAIFSILLFLTCYAAVAGNKDTKNTKDSDNSATTMITGTITDVFSGESLAGVEVKIEGTTLKTYTDFDGNFNFNNVKPGDYKITTSYISYQPVTKTCASGKADNKVKLELKPASSL